MHLYVQKLSSVWLASCKHSVMIGKKDHQRLSHHFISFLTPFWHSEQTEMITQSYISQVSLKRHVNPIVFLIGL